MDNLNKLVAVKNLDNLVSSLERANRKGYMPDALIQEWNDFDCRELLPVTDEEITRVYEDTMKQELRPQDKEGVFKVIRAFEASLLNGF